MNQHITILENISHSYIRSDVGTVPNSITTLNKEFIPKKDHIEHSMSGLPVISPATISIKDKYGRSTWLHEKTFIAIADYSKVCELHEAARARKNPLFNREK